MYKMENLFLAELVKETLKMKQRAKLRSTGQECRSVGQW